MSILSNNAAKIYHSVRKSFFWYLEIVTFNKESRFLHFSQAQIMRSSIAVVGSSNTDMVIQADHIPAAGETILGNNFFMNPGGKGANQAVAAARLGGEVKFFCKTGNDLFGHRAIELFTEEGIDVSHIINDPTAPSGVALITLDKSGDNTIVVAPGSNAKLMPFDLQPAIKQIQQSAIVLVQLEIPIETVEWIAGILDNKGTILIVNPAPARKLTNELLKNVSILTPNQTEAELLTGIAVNDLYSARVASESLIELGVGTVIITLGEQGAAILHEGKFTHVETSKVDAVDSTAAGDVFNGALAVALAEGKEMIEATRFACKAASISVTRLGAQASCPRRSEVMD